MKKNSLAATVVKVPFKIYFLLLR